MSKKISSIIYQHNWEKEFIKRNYMDFFNNFKESEINNLLSGLDSESQKTVNKIVYRLNKLKKENFEDIDIFDEYEQQQQLDLFENFYSKIQKIDDNLFAYKDYKLPIKHFEASVFYNFHCIDKFISKEKIYNKNILDVGAFIGDSALVFQSLRPSNIFSFEANPLNFDLMLRTFELNNLINVHPYCEALSDAKGSVQLSIDGSCSSIVSNQTNILNVTSNTLDNFIENNNLQIGLIKVDIEGGEPYFLKGAQNTIRKQRPYMLISIYHNWSDFVNIKPIIESWNLGYNFQVVKAIDKSIVLETLLLCEPI